jgi:pyruvate,water dikinase
MVKAGFNVPEGFVVSSDAFMSMTPTLHDLVLSHFDELRTDFVAVRSSASNEDGKNAAWAGQLDTFLNTDRENLVHNVERCWESVNSLRAQAYAKQNLSQPGRVAVIVQKMVQSDVSGVAFSVHPISNDDTQIVIEAGFGLGEAIVSGQITPDTYTVNKKTGEVIEKLVAHQAKKLVQNASGKTIWKSMGVNGKDQKLSDAQIMKLSDIISRLELFFGYPVDVEWALCGDSGDSGDTLYVLQSRPITTLTSG